MLVVSKVKIIGQLTKYPGLIRRSVVKVTRVKIKAILVVLNVYWLMVHVRLYNIHIIFTNPEVFIIPLCSIK